MIDWREIDGNAKAWVKEAGQKIKQSFQTKLSIGTKSNPDDLVTNIDKETEKYFIKKINETYPSHKILGEEGYGNKIDTLDGVIWIIDPIDGTMNFIHQQRNFAISLAVYENGVGKIGMIYDVVHDELYHAFKGEGAYLNEIKIPQLENVPVNQSILAINATWVTENRRIDANRLRPLVKAVRGTRSYGSAAIEFAYVVTGRVDTYITMRLSPWDFAAGAILIEEVGGKVSTLEGKQLNLLGENSILVSNSSLHQDILQNYILKMKNEA
ncbi:inositol monophosphatase family protein [Bacillus timonensis]|nr:inositol monophosphatase family protein [Bacillus timonensis]